MRLGMAVELLLGVFERGGIDGKARESVGEFDLMNVERALGTGDHGMAAADQALPGSPSARLDLGAVEQFDLAGDDGTRCRSPRPP